jgi:signal transduction histidine kinase/DNA-binding response OmpR family regulator
MEHAPIPHPTANRYGIGSISRLGPRVDAESRRIDEALARLARSTRIRLYLFGALGLLLLAAVGVTATLQAREGNRLRAEQEQVRATQLLLSAFGRLSFQMESGQRGYLLSERAEYLDQYNQARRDLDPLLARIDAETDAQARERFARLRDLLEPKRVEMEMSVSTAREQGFEAARQFFATGFGRELMDALQDEILTFRGELNLRANRLDAAQRESSLMRDLSLGSLLLLALVAAVAALVVLNRYVQALETERRVRREAERASRESREKSHFLAHMSHEIRTPMNAIFGFAQLLDDLVADERQRSYVRAIAQSGEALLALINDLLDLSKIEAGRLDLHPQPTDLRALLGDAAAMFAPQAAERGLALRTEIAADLPPALLVDALRLRQIVVNLVGNALKHTQEGSVTLTAQAQPEADGDTVALTLEVMDTGAGIAPAQQAAIFEPFVQAHVPEAERGGTGLGLAIVKQLVERMGGRIALHSELGRGSRFRVQLPAIPRAAPSEGSAATEAPSLHDLPPLRVLVVDDIELNRRLIEDWFAGSHHEVRAAAGGLEGVAMAQSLRPDVVLMDIRMPDLDGLAALQRIRALPELAQTRVLAVTASSLLGEEDELRRHFDGYLRKPLRRESLCLAIAAAIGHAPDAPARDPSDTREATQDDERDGTFDEALAPLRAAVAQALATVSTDDIGRVLDEARALPDEARPASLQRACARLAAAAQRFDIVAAEAQLRELHARLGRADPATTPGTP